MATATESFVLITHKLCDDVSIANAASFFGKPVRDYLVVLGGCEAHNKFFSQEERDEYGRDCHPRAYWDALTAELKGGK